MRWGGPILYISLSHPIWNIAIYSMIFDVFNFKKPFFTSSKYDFRQFPTLYLTFLLQKTAKNGTFFTSKIRVQLQNSFFFSFPYRGPDDFPFVPNGKNLVPFGHSGRFAPRVFRKNSERKSDRIGFSIVSFFDNTGIFTFSHLFVWSIEIWLSSCAQFW